MKLIYTAIKAKAKTAATQRPRSHKHEPLCIMRFLPIARMCFPHRAFSLRMRAAPAAARLPVMVPLSVLESFRADAKAHATREAVLNDSRFNEAKGRMGDLEKFSAAKVATALFERDVARGKVTARALVEEASSEAWRAWERLDADGRQQVCPGAKKIPSSVTEQVKVLVTFSGVAAYLQVVEEDNCLTQGALAKCAAVMYPPLCAPLHARAAGAQAGQLPATLFSAIGENGRIAFAALVAFGGRNVGMYEPRGATVPVVLRVPPALGLSATLQDIRGSAKLPAVPANVELGVAGGAEPFGKGPVVV